MAASSQRNAINFPLCFMQTKLTTCSPCASPILLSLYLFRFKWSHFFRQVFASVFGQCRKSLPSASVWREYRGCISSDLFIVMDFLKFRWRSCIWFSANCKQTKNKQKQKLWRWCRHRQRKQKSLKLHRFIAEFCELFVSLQNLNFAM